LAELETEEQRYTEEQKRILEKMRLLDRLQGTPASNEEAARKTYQPPMQPFYYVSTATRRRVWT
jgi:hypothetical protein